MARLSDTDKLMTPADVRAEYLEYTREQRRRQEAYIERVRQWKLERLQRKHRMSKAESDEQLKRHLHDTLELFSRIGSVYVSSEGVTVCSMRGPR